MKRATKKKEIKKAFTHRDLLRSVGSLDEHRYKLATDSKYAAEHQAWLEHHNRDQHLIREELQNELIERVVANHKALVLAGERFADVDDLKWLRELSIGETSKVYMSHAEIEFGDDVDELLDKLNEVDCSELAHITTSFRKAIHNAIGRD
ncbi:TPA: hypothetical protein ACF3XC_003847 [Vibrio parahaemolyticus]